MFRSFASTASALALTLGLLFAPAAHAQLWIPTADDGATVYGDISGSCLPDCQIENLGRVIDGDLDNYARATMPLAVGSRTTVGLRFSSARPTGNRVGFIIQDGDGILDVALLNRMTLETFRNGVLQESGDADRLLKLKVLNDGRGRVYLRTNKLADEIRLTIESGADIGGQIRIYHGWIKGANRGIQFAFPDAAYGGVSALCVLCSVDDTDNLADDRIGTEATISIPAGLPLLRTAWAGGTFADEQPALSYVAAILSVADDPTVTDSLTLTTMRGGVPVDSADAEAYRVHQFEGSDRAIVFFRTREAFDEVRLTASTNIGLALDVRIGALVSASFTGNSLSDAEVAAALTGAPSPETSASVLPTPSASSALVLGTPAPNPAASHSVLAVQSEGPVTVRALDLLGREVAVLHDGAVPAGGTTVRLDTRNLAPGVYLIQAQSASSIATRRLTVAR